MLYDCFPFFNELDLLEIRLHELAGVVDRFVLVEATRTQRGTPKPLYFHDNRHRFAAFSDRIRHVVVDDMPEGAGADWAREHHQRNAIARGLGDAGPDDLVLISDLDEIPRAAAVAAAREDAMARPSAVHCFELRRYWYYLNYEDADGTWLRHGPRLVRRAQLTSPQALRWVRAPEGSALKRLERRLDAMRLLRRPVRLVLHRDAGWHFSYLNGIEAVIQKTHALVEGRDVEWLDRAWVAQRIAEGRGLNPTDPSRFVLRAIDDTLPRHVLENRDRFAHLLATPESLAALAAEGGSVSPRAASPGAG